MVSFLEIFENLIGWVIKLSVETFQPLIVIYKRGKFVYHHWRYIIGINLSAIVLSMEKPPNYLFKAARDTWLLRAGGSPHNFYAHNIRLNVLQGQAGVPTLAPN